MDVFEPAQTKCASPTVSVPKKYGTLLFCIYYSKMNAMTIQNSSPILGVNESINSFGEATIFLTLEGNRRNEQVEIAKDNWNKTAFPPDQGLFVLLACPSDE